MTKKMKALAVSCLAVFALYSSGCNWQQWILNAGIVAAAEFLVDNDAVWDVFEDGATAANP